MTKINLTAVFEHVLGTSEISSKEDLKKVIDALRVMENKPLFSDDEIEAIGKKLGTDEAKK